MKNKIILLLVLFITVGNVLSINVSAELYPYEIDIYEEEPNDSPDLADIFEPLNRVYGAVDGEDVDFYQITIEHPGNFRLIGNGWSLDTQNVENNEGLVFSLFDDQGNFIAESEYTGIEENHVGYNIIDEIVVPGTYFVGVENLNAELENYVFSGDLRLGTARLEGMNRYNTSVSISQAGWDSSYYAVLTTGGNFPDALSAAPLATKYDAPLLLTEPNKSTVTASVLSEIKRLKVKEVFIIGGNGAVTSGAEKQLANLGVKVTRLGGSTRYDTAIKVAEKLGNNGEFAIVTGTNFADALSISSIAASQGMPIILTDRNAIPTSVSNYLNKQSIKKAYVIGGPAIISGSVKNKIPTSIRIYGSDRYATNKAIVDQFKTEIDFTNVFLATGANYPDALSGAALAGSFGAPLVLTNSKPTISTINIIKENNLNIGALIALGGTGVVPNYTVNELIKYGNPNIRKFYLD